MAFSPENPSQGRKRKNDEPSRSSRKLWLLLGIGLLLLALLTGGAVWLLSSGAKVERITSSGKILILASTDNFVTTSKPYTINVNGTELNSVSGLSDFRVLAQAWSPDGQYVAISAIKEGGTPKIYFMNTNGTEAKRLTRKDFVSETSPTWSPDSKLIAYEEYDNDPGTYTIHIASVDGSSSQELLPDHLEQKKHPQWSPDGKVLALLDFKRSQELYLVTPEGENLRRLVDGQVNEDFAWSLDSQWLAFSSNRTGKNTIFIVKADGSGLKQLTEATSSSMSPSWSPDGTQIAFASDRGGKWQIYVMTKDGSNVSRLTNSDLYETHPVWLTGRKGVQ